MTDNRPPPMTDADSDLTAYREMPLEVVRFLNSDLMSEIEPEAALAAIRLWCVAWHQRPAGSLSKTDKALAKAAGYGVAVSAWLAVKDEALRGWAECSDGRLYHPVVSEKARAAWLSRLKQMHRNYLGAIRQHNGRNPSDNREAPSFEEWLERGRPDTVVRGQRAPQQTDLPLKEPENADLSRATNKDVTRDKDGSHASFDHQGKGREGKGREGNHIDYQPPTPAEPEKPDIWAQDLPSIANHLGELAGVSLLKPNIIATAIDMVRTWKAAGYDMETTVAEAIRRYRIDNPDQHVASLAYFDSAVKRLAAKNKNGVKPLVKREPDPPIDGTDDDDSRIPAMRDALRQRIGNRVYETWAGPARTVWSINGDMLDVRASSGFVGSWIRQHYESDLFTIARGHGFDGVHTTP